MSTPKVTLAAKPILSLHRETVRILGIKSGLRTGACNGASTPPPTGCGVTNASDVCASDACGCGCSVSGRSAGACPK
jgi:hypothetical protein